MELTRLGVDILGASKIRWQENGYFWSNDYCVIYCSGKKPGRTGVGFIINKKWGQQVINKIAYNDRLILVKLKAKSIDIIIIQV